jgi:Pvc16 N-terminal domain
MSNSLAIAATSATLRNLLDSNIRSVDPDLPSGLLITTFPPDVMAKSSPDEKPGLNLFLYQVLPNAAWRNKDMPFSTRPGETGMPPLALNLHYLITAYGKYDGTLGNLNERILGAAMSVLHDHAVLDRGEIRSALAGNDLGAQFERLRITPLSMNLEEISKLWMVFQTQYRMSMAYEVTVVLIDSNIPTKAPLPVLKRGREDRGGVAVTGGAPSLTAVVPPNSQPATRLGETVVFSSENLSGDAYELEVLSQRPGSKHKFANVSVAADGNVLLSLPRDASAMHEWMPGYYTAVVKQKRPNVPDIVSNEIVFALAPRIAVLPKQVVAGTFVLTVKCEPRIADEQRVLLLFGSKQFDIASLNSPADITLPTTLTFEITETEVKKHVVRLRVDGVDSIPVVIAGTPPLPTFDPDQMVAVQ